MPVTMNQSDISLYQTNSLLFVKACGFIEENASLVMQVTGMNCTALEVINKIAACRALWRAKGGLSAKYCKAHIMKAMDCHKLTIYVGDKLLLSEYYPLLPGDLEAASTFLLRTGDAKRVLEKSTAFTKVSHVGRACLMAQLILHGHSRTINKLEVDYHHQWLKVSEGTALLSSSATDAMWSYAGLLARQHEQWPADDCDKVLKLILSYVSSREAARVPKRAKQQSASYRQNNNAASKKSRVAKKAQDPVAFARKLKASNAKSVEKVKEVRGHAQYELETQANKLRSRVKDHLRKTGYSSEAAKLIASILIPYARGQTVPWRDTDDMTNVPTASKVQELLEKARLDLKTFSAYQAWLDESKRAIVKGDADAKPHEDHKDVEQVPLAEPSSIPRAHPRSAPIGSFPASTGRMNLASHFSGVGNSFSNLFPDQTPLSDEDTDDELPPPVDGPLPPLPPWQPQA